MTNSYSRSRSVIGTQNQFALSSLLVLGSLFALMLPPDAAIGRVWIAIPLVLAVALAIHAQMRLRGYATFLSSALRQYTKGDLEARLWPKQEGGALFELADDINQMVDSVDAFLREARAAMQSAMQEKYFRKIQLTGLSGTYRSCAQTFNEGLDKIRENTMRSIRHAVTELDAVARQGDDQAKQLLSSVSTTSGSIGTVAAAMEEMGATISEIAKQIEQAKLISENTTERARDSGNRLTELSDSIANITSITQAIQQITNQTNLLALNATIEAARAGDAGKGFAVVAGEVKQLAGNTSQATAQISQHVQKVEDQLKLVVEAMNDMVGLVRNMNEATLIISSAMTEQTAATQEIVRAVGSASESSRAVKDTAEQVATQAERTFEVSRNMQSMCG